MPDQQLVDFLTARIVDDRVRATMRQWHTADCDSMPDPDGYTYPCDCAVHAVLVAEADAKARIVALAGWEGPKTTLRDRLFGPAADVAFTAGIDVALRSLAYVYADHPDYQDRWRR